MPKPFDLGSIWPTRWRKVITTILLSAPLAAYSLKWAGVALAALLVYYFGVYMGRRSAPLKGG